MACRVRLFDSTPPPIGFRFITSYIVEGGKAVAVIDPGPANTTANIARHLIASGFKNVEIILTHIHLDHASGAGLLARVLREAGASVRVWVHPRGLRHIVEPSKLWSASLEAMGDSAYVYGYPCPAPAEAVVATDTGETLDLGGVELVFLHTPGHASHHQAIIAECNGGRVAFTGDAAGMYIAEAGGLAPTTPPPFHPDKYLESLNAIAEAKPDTIAPTHNSPGPAKLLELHRRQVEGWLEAAKEFEGGPEEFLAAMLSRDELAGRAYRLLGRSRHTRRVLLHTAEGMLSAVRSGKGNG